MGLEWGMQSMGASLAERFQPEGRAKKEGNLAAAVFIAPHPKVHQAAITPHHTIEQGTPVSVPN